MSSATVMGPDDVASRGGHWTPTGAELLDRVGHFLRRFIAYPSEHTAAAHVLWIAHAHLMDAWESTPRLAFLSPEPGSGKSRCLELTELLVPHPVQSVNFSAAYLIRKVADEAGRPTILHDEIDTVFGPRAKDNEELRGLLNAGHRRGAVAGRCVVRGKEVFTEELPAYCAVAMAGLGGLPDTILTRSVVVRMKRRAPGEVVEPFRRRDHAPQGYALRDQLARWASPAERALADARPTMPDSVADRDADVWEPLIAIADAAGGDWPQRARVAAVTLVTESKAGTPSLGIRLLADIRAVLRTEEQMTTVALLESLNGLEESPWGDIKGKPLDGRGLARWLKPFGVERSTIRIGNATAKGYRREDFHDAWRRYLPSPPQESVTSVTLSRPSPTMHFCPRCTGEGCDWCEAGSGTPPPACFDFEIVPAPMATEGNRDGSVGTPGQPQDSWDSWE